MAEAREIRTSGSKRGDWKRGHGSRTEARSESDGTRTLTRQSSTLPIAGEEDGRYRLDYPNLKVRRSLGELLEANDFERPLFRGVFAPHPWYMNSAVANYEAHFASVQLLGRP